MRGAAEREDVICFSRGFGTRLRSFGSGRAKASGPSGRETFGILSIKFGCLKVSPTSFSHILNQNNRRLFCRPVFYYDLSSGVSMRFVVEHAPLELGEQFRMPSKVVILIQASW